MTLKGVITIILIITLNSLDFHTDCVQLVN